MELFKTNRYTDLYENNPKFKEYVDKLHNSSNYSNYSIPFLLSLKIVQEVGEYYISFPKSQLTTPVPKCDCDLTEDKSC